MIPLAFSITQPQSSTPKIHLNSPSRLLPQHCDQTPDKMNSLPLSCYSPASRIQFQKITDGQYAQYVHLYEASKRKCEEKITRLTSMRVHNMVQGEAGRAQDYNEFETWVKLEINNLHDA